MLNMNPKPSNARMSQFTLAVSMVIFGTVPLIRHYIPLSSPLVAFFRGLLGTLVLLLVMFMPDILRSADESDKKSAGKGKKPKRS